MLLSQTLIAVIVIIFLLTAATTVWRTTWLWYSPLTAELSFRPVYLKTGESLYTLMTAIYIHANLFHFVFNVLAIFMICMLFEEKIGTLRFAVMFFATGILAKILYAFATNFTSSGLIGASGAIFGILGAYARLYPNEKFAFFPIPYPLPVYTWAFIFFIGSLILHFVDVCLIPDVAHLSHAMGIFAGLAIAPLVMKLPDKKKKKEKKVDLEALEQLVQTDEDRELFKKIKTEDEPEVRDAWIEHFISRAQCPQCGGMMIPKGKTRTLGCTCGFELKY